jgi:tetratricopeptide (TPR) repeat protein
VKAKPGTSRPPAVLPPRQAISVPTQEVKVEPEPVIAATPGTPVTKISPSAVAQPQSDSYVQNGVTPLPRLGSIAPAGASQNSGSPSKSLPLVQSAPASFPRYHYLSPSKPSPGDRRAASGAFTRAQEYEQSSRWTYALEWYRRATQSDPGWFEAQYNYGVLAYRLRNYSASLTAYETALAIQPDSTDARYNFALALKAAGYAVDAVNELKKIVAANPGDVRSQLALGNLYAQQLREPAAARQHYLKVLELDPHNPQATDIRFWLSANPE